MSYLISKLLDGNKEAVLEVLAEGEFRLTVELVPASAWRDNLRLRMGRSWDILRRKVYSEFGGCAVCGEVGRLECHEIWSYDDSQRIQSLVGFVALCKLCHLVKHLGMAGVLASEGQVDYGDLIFHFMDVNSCSRKTFEDYRSSAFELWRKRSQFDWQLNLGKWSSILA